MTEPTELTEEPITEKTELDKKLDFIVNFLFDIYCHSDVHYVELIESKLKEAEKYGFDVEKSKRWID